MQTAFPELFKKYRLKAEFATLSELGNALAEKGFNYEDSIFSHWQKGTRIPNNRQLLISLLQIFIERKAIHSTDEANELLSSAHQGYLTAQEMKKISFKESSNIPFQVPRKIAHFTGREDVIRTISKQVSQGGIFLIHGPSGIGKTALAITLGHRLKNKFSDGVLWYKVDSSNSMDILLSIAYTFRENISAIQHLETRASVVRSLLANKKILVIFDNVEQNTNVRVLLPNSSSTVILTSKYQHLPIDSSYESISLTSFTTQETQILFAKILSGEYVKNHQEDIKKLGEKVGNLPLALHIYAKHIAITKQSPKSLLQRIDKSKISLQELSYEDKNLYTSIDISSQSLDDETKNIFLSLGIFAGKDFSLDAIAAIHTISKNKTMEILQNLINASLLEESSKQRYRLHPIIKQYILDTAKIKSRMYIKPAAHYFAEFLEKYKRKNTKFYNTKNIYPEKENILSILEQCEKQKLTFELIKIWENLGMFFTQTGEWNKVIYHGEKITALAKSNNTYYRNTMYLLSNLDSLARIYYFSGNMEKLKKITFEGLKIAQDLDNEYAINYCKQRLGKIYQYFSKFDESLSALKKSVTIFKKYNDIAELAYTYKFIAEIYIFKYDISQTKRYLQKALHILNATKDITLLGIIYTTLGTVFYIQRNFEEAKIHLMQGIDLERKYGIRIAISLFSYLILALISRENGDIEKSEKYFSLAKKENEYLKIKRDAEKLYAIVFLLKEKLKQAGYYIFE